ncbi:ABC transporter ATP-binding protein [Methylopila jiangsuensis]|uniref:ABC transporter ATP-binding protein n=1 Tax=Methylopila jiangsuensis TaxID=586230 RepID=A0A9W6JIL0_9HYPH|nr:ABC transporter ATP-binding protein [Methylopila jiangsuensis]MDR6284905.1 NitT/TauT family transport system ATP-binding protein [Methylopila jiangsuensis]GLK77707.1 ABC transporter ATP-binding protein [Methylopila jiangsuensis]
MSAAPPLLEAVDLSFRYDAETVLDRVSFALSRGEVLALLGPSGCGKTTLLNLIAGFNLPGSGRLTLEGAPIAGPGSDRAVVFQGGALFDWLTARANVEFALSCRGVAKAERRRASDRLLALVGLADVADRFPYEMSGGMRQRVGVARVLAAEPRVMLMDEPFAAVDVQTRETLQEEVLRINAATRCAIVFVTHDIEEAVFVADRVLVLSRGGGGVAAEFRVDLPAPRWNALNRLRPEFLRLREEIYLTMKDGLRPAAESRHAAA